jgi:hypothetical protein
MGRPMFAAPDIWEATMQRSKAIFELAPADHLPMAGHTPCLYAWKIMASNRDAIEGITTLGELEARLLESRLPMRRSPADIIAQTLIMEYEGEGIYRHRDEDGYWTLIWVALR